MGERVRGWVRKGEVRKHDIHFIHFMSRHKEAKVTLGARPKNRGGRGEVFRYSFFFNLCCDKMACWGQKRGQGRERGRCFVTPFHATFFPFVCRGKNMEMSKIYAIRFSRRTDVQTYVWFALKNNLQDADFRRVSYEKFCDQIQIKIFLNRTITAGALN
jgi:hypothetical protein